MEQLDDLVAKSFLRPQVIFKHSTRCSISSMVLQRLERETQPDGMDFYYLDLLLYRPVSNAIAEKFHVYHESPQIIVIRDGDAIYDESHLAIQMQEIAANL
jgi:bacillithiol system protein YtxJ